MYVTFAAQGHVGHIAQTGEKDLGTSQTFVNVTCLPLFSILMALDNPIIDYFSLDVEGSELAVLKTIPFDKVNIMVRNRMKTDALKMSKIKGGYSLKTTFP